MAVSFVLKLCLSYVSSTSLSTPFSVNLCDIRVTQLLLNLCRVLLLWALGYKIGCMSELLGIEELLSTRRDKKVRTGVIYFLFSGDSLVYIGQTTSLGHRLSCHDSEWVIEFDSYSFIDTSHLSERERKLLEAKYINKYKPKHNKKRINWQPKVELALWP